jgi:hypothetical protein
MAILTEEDRLSYRIVSLIAVVALLAIPVTALRLFAALVILCYLPAAPFAARTGLPALSAVALAVTVSPIMIALPVLALMQLGLPVETAVWAIVGIVMAQFLVYGTQRALTTTPSERRLLLALAVVIAVAAFLTLWLPATNTWWRYREDSWFHAAVFRRIANFGLPAIDPYFTPLKLQYMYFYHILLLTVSTLTGMGPFGAMIFTNFIALGGCVLGFNFLAGMFTRRSAVRVIGIVLCVFGMNGLFYLFFPIRVARAFLGETSGTEILRHFFTLSPLSHETASRFVSVEGNQHLFLDKFMLGTALSLTLGLVCVLLALIVLARSNRWRGVMSFFFVAVLVGVMFLHLVIGGTVIAATVGATAVAAVLGRRRGKGEGGLAPVWILVFAAAAVAISLPYIMSVTPREGVGNSVGVRLQVRQIIGILASMLPVLIPAVWYLVRGERPRRALADGGGLSPSGLIAAWAGIVLVMALVIDLPTNNETKFAFPLYLALAALAVGGLDRWTAHGRRYAAAVAYVALCTLPLSAVYFAGAFSDRSKFVITQSELSVYDWIRKTTRKEAIFLEGNDIVRIPVLASRDQYWGTETYARNWGYSAEELAPRRALRDAVFGEGEIDYALFEHAESLDRPFYIILRDIHSDEGRRFKRLSDRPFLTGKFLSESIAVFEFTP